MSVKLGEVWKNKKPYEGEGEIIIGKEHQNGIVECIHANHTKYPGLNGGVELKPVETILRYYEKISD